MLDKAQTKILIKELSGFIQKIELQSAHVETIKPFVNEIKDIFLKHVYQVGGEASKRTELSKNGEV